MRTFDFKERGPDMSKYDRSKECLVYNILRKYLDRSPKGSRVYQK